MRIAVQITVLLRKFNPFQLCLSHCLWTHSTCSSIITLFIIYHYILLLCLSIEALFTYHLQSLSSILTQTLGTFPVLKRIHIVHVSIAISNWHTTLLSYLHTITQVILMFFLIVEFMLFMITNNLNCLQPPAVSRLIGVPKSLFTSGVH